MSRMSRAMTDFLEFEFANGEGRDMVEEGLVQTRFNGAVWMWRKVSVHKNTLSFFILIN